MSDKNGPMGRADLKPYPRQCTVWPNAYHILIELNGKPILMNESSNIQEILSFNCKFDYCLYVLIY